MDTSSTDIMPSIAHDKGHNNETTARYMHNEANCEAAANGPISSFAKNDVRKKPNMT